MPAKRRSYSLEDREAGLAALVLQAGSSTKAHQALKQQGLDVPQQTLDSWKTQHAERYAELQAHLAPKVADKIAAGAERLALMIEEAESKLIASMMDDLESMDAKEKAAALRNLSTSKALQVDKLSSPLRGRPTVIHQAQDAGQALIELGRRLGFAVDSTAEEIKGELEAAPHENA